jgi:hypothetical protein
MIFSLRSQLAARHPSSMTEKLRLRHAGLVCLLLCAALVTAQTRKGPEPQAQRDVLRAVSVYEWTGDLSKPTAARIVPVSLYIDHHFEDAALYLSRPMPLALEPGNIYELESAGVNRGTLTLKLASRLHSDNAVTSFDDGWFGYATWKPLAPPKPFVPSSATSSAHVVTSGEQGPHFSKAPASTSPSTTQSTSSTTPPVDPNRPTLHHTAPGDPQQSAPQSSSTPTASTTPPASASPAPTLSPAPPASTPAPATPPVPDQSKPGNTPAGDPDRPTLNHSTPADRASNQQHRRGSDSASVTDAGGLLADDPGRPHLHHGGASADAALPALRGLPPDMHQMAAVSDAADRPEHDFAYEWPDADQKAAVITKLEAMAQAALAPAPAKPAPASVHKHRTVTHAPIALLEEELHAYEISYGGVDVYVFTAQTEDHRYVTLIVQPDIYGTLQILLRSVAGPADLDQTPQMRFIDAVDADGDNRAELLFELRGETERQFALYRIAQGTAEQIFLSGTLQ